MYMSSCYVACRGVSLLLISGPGLLVLWELHKGSTSAATLPLSVNYSYITSVILCVENTALTPESKAAAAHDVQI